MVLCGWHECSNVVPETAELGPEDFCSDECRSRFVAMFDAAVATSCARGVRATWRPLWIAGPGVVLPPVPAT